MKKQLVALWLVVMLVSAAFTGGTTLAVLSDSEQAQVTISVAGNGEITITAGNSAPATTSTTSSDEPGIDYVAFVSEDSDPGVSWSVNSENANREPKSIFWWATEMNTDVDYVVVGYEYDGQDKVNIYDYTGRDGVAGTATSLGSSDPTRSIANVTSYNVSSALGVNEIEEKANRITDEALDDANTSDITANTTLKIAYDANSDEFTGKLAGQSYTLPKAVDDSYSTAKDVKRVVDEPGVIRNDDGDALSVEVVTGPSNGALVLKSNGEVTYEPDSGFTGEDSFTYRLSDGVAADTATVNITVAESS